MAEKIRCNWVGDDDLYRAYHDEEWGVPERVDRALFEKLILDGFQAGLSWITILRKRDNFRTAFEGFDYVVAPSGSCAARIFGIQSSRIAFIACCASTISGSPWGSTISAMQIDSIVL